MSNEGGEHVKLFVAASNHHPKGTTTFKMEFLTSKDSGKRVRCFALTKIALPVCFFYSRKSFRSQTKDPGILLVAGGTHTNVRQTYIHRMTFWIPPQTPNCMQQSLFESSLHTSSWRLFFPWGGNASEEIGRRSWAASTIQDQLWDINMFFFFCCYFSGEFLFESIQQCRFLCSFFWSFRNLSKPMWVAIYNDLHLEVTPNWWALGRVSPSKNGGLNLGLRINFIHCPDLYTWRIIPV